MCRAAPYLALSPRDLSSPYICQPRSPNDVVRKVIDTCGRDAGWKRWLFLARGRRASSKMALGVRAGGVGDSQKTAARESADIQWLAG